MTFGMGVTWRDVVTLTARAVLTVVAGVKIVVLIMNFLGFAIRLSLVQSSKLLVRLALPLWLQMLFKVLCMVMCSRI